MDDQDKEQIQHVLEKEVNHFEEKEVNAAKMAYINQTTAEETQNTIEKYEEELNQIGDFELK